MATKPQNPPDPNQQKTMKTRLLHSLTTTCAALALASVAGINTARADFTVQSFDTSASLPDSLGGGLSGSSTEIWDGTVNGPNGPTGGSLYVTLTNTTAIGGWNELQLGWTMNVDMGSYINCEFDYKIDEANSATNTSGNYGACYPVIQSWTTGSPGWCQLSSTTFIGGGWHHYSGSLAAFSGQMTRFNLDINTGSGQIGNTNDPTRGVSLWIDNIIFTSPALPPPTLSSTLIPAPKQQGLTFFPATSSQYQRVMVYPNNASTYGWYGVATAGNPVSYSFTITNWPNNTHYTAQLFLIPNVDKVYGNADTSVDWNCTNDVIFSIAGGTNNPDSLPATNWGVQLAAKTNAPGAIGNGNPNLILTNITIATAPVGTWTVTFNNNTDFVITGPNGFSTSGSLPPDVANLVSGNHASDLSMVPYFGVQNNAIANIGVPAVFSQIQVSGTPTAINDNFNTGSLDTNVWSKLTDYQPDIWVGNGDLKFWVTWNTPNDSGYSTLLAAPTAAGPWSDLVPSTSWWLVNGTRYASITGTGMQSALGQNQNVLFKLIKRQFTQLQVLLPGETNAPGTLSGKIGTPIPQTTTTAFTVTVNACDSTWHICNSADTIHLTSSDGSAFIPVDTGMSGGVATFSGANGFLFQTTGSQTITATDVTDGTKTANTSSSVTVN